MTKINCDVTNCSYNCSGNCFSNRIDIGGMASCSENDTCCGSFLDKKHYSDLTNCAENCTPCDCLVCKVSSCAHSFRPASGSLTWGHRPVPFRPPP